MKLSNISTSSFIEDFNLSSYIEEDLKSSSEIQVQIDFTNQKRKIIFFELCGLIQTMFNFNISQSHIHQNIILLSKEYKIPAENVQTLLCDLCRYHQIVITKPPLHSEIEYSLSKRQKERAQHGKPIVNIILSYCTSFLDSASTLIMLLRLNKEISTNLKSKITKRLYYKRKNTIDTKNLLEFWSITLKINQLKINYSGIKKEMAENKAKLETVSDTIKIDNERMLKGIIGSDISEQLTNVLMCYAYFDDQVQYCQGMNFLVGLIMNIVKNEEITFRLLTQLIKKNEMSLLFSDGTPLLRQFFYQLDKLIYIYIPNLSLHFKVYFIRKKG